MTLIAGKTSRAFALNVTPLARLSLTADTDSTFTGDSVTVTATLLDESGRGVFGVTLTWEPNSADTSVTLTPAATPSTTDENGQATATLTSTAAQTVKVKASAEVNGILMESDWLEVDFSANAYTLAASPSTLAVNQPKNVTFTLMKNNSPAPNGTAITFTQDSNFDGLTTSAIPVNGGTFTVSNLTAKSMGTKTLKATVDGVEVTCEIKVAGLTLTVTNGVDFVTGSSNGYQSTGKVEAKFDDGNGPQPISEQIIWKLISVTQPSGAWWRRTGSNNTHGLAWGNNFSSGTPDNPVINLNDTTANTGSEIEITDIVGSRSVTLEASVTIGSVTYTEEATVAFGAGPLSVFNTAPSSGSVQWATASGAKDDDIDLNTASSYGDFTAADTKFPAIEVATGIVGTKPNNTGFTFGVSGSNEWTAKFPLTGWGEPEQETGYGARYAKGSRLPTVKQLQAVAMETGKGAAYAAGWPQGRYWSGEVYFHRHGNFYARFVFLDDGVADGSDVVADGLERFAERSRRLPIYAAYQNPIPRHSTSLNTRINSRFRSIERPLKKSSWDNPSTRPPVDVIVTRSE